MSLLLGQLLAPHSLCESQFVQCRLEWESDSGRQLSITDVPVSELSKVEVEGLQRQAVTVLQSMDVPVSHGVIKGK